MAEELDFSQFDVKPLVGDLDEAIQKGLIQITKYTKSGDGVKQVEKLSTNQYKLHNYDDIRKSGGIKIQNTSDNRYFAFKIQSENTGYFDNAGIVGAFTNADSAMVFVLGPNLRFEIDIDSEYDNLDVCYLEAAYLTGERNPDGSLEVQGRSKDFDSKHDNEVVVTFLGERRIEQLPNLKTVFTATSDSYLLDLYGSVSANLQRFTGFDEGRDLARTNPYNTVKLRKDPITNTPTLVREIVPGYPTEMGVNWSDGATGEGPVGSLLPGDDPGPVYSASKNLPSFLYPFSKEDGGRYTVMDLAESDAPSFLSIGPIEAVAGNEIEKMGDLPYFRFWGDAVLMTPIVISAVAVGVGVFFLAPVMVPPAIQAVKPLATSVVKIPVAIYNGVIVGGKGVYRSLSRIPSSVMSGYKD